MDSKSGFKLVRSVKADTFDIESLDRYTLLLQIGLRDIQAAAFDESRATLEWLEDYALPEFSGHSSFTDILNTIRENSTVLPAGFWKRLVVCSKSTQFINLPAGFPSAENAADYLKLNSRYTPESETIHACTTGDPDSVCVFGTPSFITQWIDDVYTKIPKQVIHQSATLIASALKSSASSGHTTMHLMTDRFRMHLTAVGKTGLLYYNQFAIKEFSDYAKYLSVAFHILKLDPEICPVTLWGFMTRQSPHALELKDLVKTLEFGQLRNDVRVGAGITGIQEHQYPDLFSALTVSALEL